ncbi:single-stranded-DNA-specific exonuclease RecJ [Spiribacter salinus]|uniref:single-stranded-DNA-specific exonuclease RecJ n=1 Tax=Spiribacter salinus TaxID=1335746 RepID=UPI001C944E8B|nr:single-stranded-DNA-specific exonuclease RecJ [Spiribacter salinus]
MNRGDSIRFTDRPVPTPWPVLPDGLPGLLQRLYAARGVDGAGDLDYRLAQLPHPDTLNGLEAAAAIMAQAIITGQRILVVGDFDADGATSCAVALRGLRALGAASVDYLVPNRFEFGYGLSPELVEVARGHHPDLILTVDNGISAHAGIEAASAAGIPVVVTDHHLPGPTLPAAAAIVNPQVASAEFAGQGLAGVGVCFYLLLGVRSALRNQDWFTTGRPEPGLVDLLDLVALGTIADVVPLDRVNRVLVAQGLRRIRVGQGCPGVQALLKASRREPARVNAADLGFGAAPRLNAAGRLGDMSLGIETLLAEDTASAEARAKELETLNQTRRELEHGMRDEALAGIEAAQLAADGALEPVLCLYDEQWHQGVVGIVASRIKERFQRPVIAFAPAEDGLLKGSGRSIAGVHLRDLLEAVDTRTEGAVIQRFGGHAMAAGLTLPAAQYPAFQSVLQGLVRERMGDHPPGEEIVTDGELEAAEFSLELARQIREGGPWGPGFPEPSFRGLFHVRSQRVVGENHLKLMLSPACAPNQQLDAIAFNALDRGWSSDTRQITGVFRLDVNYYRGREQLQLVFDYLAAA